MNQQVQAPIKAPVKKEFVTTWSMTQAQPDYGTPTWRRAFFESGRMINPDEIPFLALHSFLGKKTRVTIEVIE